MIVLLLLPYFVQAFLITFDEWYFHIKRGLPKWERIGHPIDTFSIVLCLLVPLCFSLTKSTLTLYVVLCVVSCLLVTKDEFVHKHHCPAAENWVHALLFLNHPLLLTATGLIWSLYAGSPLLFLQGCVPYSSFLHAFLKVQCCIACLFMLYQIIYWNFVWTRRKQTS